MPQFNPNTFSFPFTSSIQNRIIFFLAFLCLEVILVSIRFDTGSLPWSSSFLIKIIEHGGDILKLGFAIAACIIMLAFSRSKQISNILDNYQFNLQWKPWFFSHLLSISVFLILTVLLFTRSVSEPMLNLVAFLWGFVGLCSVIFLFFSIAPFKCWYQLIKQEYIVIVVAIIAGGLAWLAGGLAGRSWAPLANLTFELCNQLLSFIYSDITYNFSLKQLGTPEFAVIIKQQCSGYEGMGLVTVFFSIYLWGFRKTLRFPHVFLLFPVAILAIWLLNALRIVLLIVIGSSFSPAIAIGGFHSNAGWLSFILVSAALALFSQRIAFFNIGSVAKQRNTSTKGHLASALIMPFVVLLTSILITNTFNTGFDWLYPIRVILVSAVLWYFRELYKKIFKDVTINALFIGTVVFIVWVLLIDNSKLDNQLFLNGLSEGSTIMASAWLFFRIIGACITVPIVEELVFRGYLINKLIDQDFKNIKPIHFTWISFITSSLLFGLMHSDWFAGILAGMGYAYVLYQRGEVSDAIIAHMTTNTLLTIYVLASGNWSMW